MLKSRNLALSSLIVATFSLSGCLLPSGINPSLGCSPINGCTAKDYYLPGKGVWAPKSVVFGKKAMIGTIVGAGLGSYLGRGSDPLTLAAVTVGGLVLGREVGSAFDKIDQMHATMVLRGSLNMNRDGEMTTWKSPKKDIQVSAMPKNTQGTCREFISDVIINGNSKKVEGTACKVNGQWELKEMKK